MEAVGLLFPPQVEWNSWEKITSVSSLKPLFRYPSFFSCCVAMLSFLLFIKWRKEEREEDEQTVIEISPGESGRCVTLVIVKRLSRCISCRDSVPPSRVTARTPAPTRLGDLISGCSFFGGAVRSWGGFRASFLIGGEEKIMDGSCTQMGSCPVAKGGVVVG